ncbi:MAG: hypothetical protein V4628_12255 [Pseudomonadota bacterium]
METKFTPGPWETSKRIDDRMVSTSELEIADVSMVDPCEKRGFKFSEQSKANAQLVAAAPDLYAALERMARLHRHDGCLCQPINRTCAPCQADEALAKARGE